MNSNVQPALISIFLMILWLLPIIIAMLRKARNVGQVVIVDLFLGWTGIGWIVALVMAFTSNRRTAVNGAG